MCLFLYNPSASINIDYAAESISLQDGGSVDIVDLLVTNHSSSYLDRLHIVYPHAIPFHQTSERYFVDLTRTWLEMNSSYNYYYKHGFVRMETSTVAAAGASNQQVRAQDVGTKITIWMPDPENPTSDLKYEGFVRGDSHLTRYQPDDRSVFDVAKWRALEFLGFSVFTLRFDIPIKPTEARWLRFKASGGRQRQNWQPRAERMVEKGFGICRDTFEVAGPLDVKHRIISHLRAAGRVGAEADLKEVESAVAVTTFQSVEDAVLVRGILAKDTETAVKDWRLSVFWSGYRYLDEPVSDGDIRPLGPARTLVNIGPDTEVEAYQYKAGEYNVKPMVRRGLFTVRFVAHEIPLLVHALPWIALLISFVGLAVSVFALTLE